jgi:hypothetical protein
MHYSTNCQLLNERRSCCVSILPSVRVLKLGHVLLRQHSDWYRCGLPDGRIPKASQNTGDYFKEHPSVDRYRLMICDLRIVEGGARSPESFCRLLLAASKQSVNVSCARSQHGSGSKISRRFTLLAITIIRLSQPTVLVYNFID